MRYKNIYCSSLKVFIISTWHWLRPLPLPSFNYIKLRNIASSGLSESYDGICNHQELSSWCWPWCRIGLPAELHRRHQWWRARGANSQAIHGRILPLIPLFSLCMNTSTYKCPGIVHGKIACPFINIKLYSVLSICYLFNIYKTRWKFSYSGAILTKEYIKVCSDFHTRSEGTWHANCHKLFRILFITYKKKNVIIMKFQHSN